MSKGPEAEIVKMHLGNKTRLATMESSNRGGFRAAIDFTSFMDHVLKGGTK